MRPVVLTVDGLARRLDRAHINGVLAERERRGSVEDLLTRIEAGPPVPPSLRNLQPPVPHQRVNSTDRWRRPNLWLVRNERPDTSGNIRT